MSKFTKFLALALATLMVAGMMVFTAPAAAAADYEPTGDYASDIALLSALDVMMGDGVSFNEEAPVSRWQMALFIARIVTGETGNDMWEAEKSAYYTDVDASDYPGAIDFCYDMGYMNGVGDNKFNPDGNIMYQDALTLLVRLLGYETADTKYPWGHILTAQDIVNVKTEYLTDDIDAGYRADLKREEVANLIAKALYVNRIGGYNADGTPKYKGTLMTTGLKATDLGTATLVATANAALNGYAPTEDYSKVVFHFENAVTIGDDDNVTEVEVDVENLTKDAKFHNNDLLGFTAALVTINVKREPVVFADMDNITVVDKYGATDKAFQKKAVDEVDTFFVGSTAYKVDTFLTYGDAADNVFVETDINALPVYGRAIICDVNNDGATTADIVRFVEFNRTSALYTFDLAFNLDGAEGFTKGTVIPFYFAHNYTNATAKLDAAATILPATATKKAGNEKSILVDVGAGFDGATIKFKGFYLGTGLTGGNATDTEAKEKTPLTSMSDLRTKISALNVAVIGDIVNGQIHIGATKVIGDLTFVTVAKDVETATGVADFGGLTGEGELKLGDTAFEYGFAAPNKNGWLASDAVVGNTLLTEKVEYMTANGAIVSMKKYIAPDEDEEEESTDDPRTKDYFILNFKSKGDFTGSNVTLNADGTITLNTYNAATGEYADITVNQLNGIKLGNLINTFGLEVAADLFGFDGDTLAEIIYNFINDELAFINYDVNTVDDKGNDDPADDETIPVSKRLVGIAAVANKTGDVYDLTDNYEGLKLPALDENIALTFTKYEGKSLSNGTYSIGAWNAEDAIFDYADKILSVTTATKFVAIAADGIKVYENYLPSKVDTFTADLDEVAVLAISNELVVVFAPNTNADVIFNFPGAVAGTPADDGDKFFTLSWKTTYAGFTAKKDADNNPCYEYTFKNVRNAVTGATEDIVIVSTVYSANPAATFFADAWKGTTSPIAAANLSSSNKLTQDGATAQADLYTVYKYNADLEAPVEATIAEFAAVLKYEFGVIENVVAKDANQLLIRNADDEKTVNIVVSYTFDKYNVAKDDKADNIKTAQTCANIADDAAEAALEGQTVLYSLDEKTGECHFIVGLKFAPAVNPVVE